jgi:hypothetical protein
VQSSSWTTNLGSLAVQWLTIAIYCHLLPSQKKNAPQNEESTFPVAGRWEARGSISKPWHPRLLWWLA